MQWRRDIHSFSTTVVPRKSFAHNRDVGVLTSRPRTPPSADRNRGQLSPTLRQGPPVPATHARMSQRTRQGCPQTNCKCRPAFHVPAGYTYRGESSTRKGSFHVFTSDPMSAVYDSGWGMG